MGPVVGVCIPQKRIAEKENDIERKRLAIEN
jgi:hypothetical protein